MPGIGFSTSASISWHRYHSGKRTGIFMAAAFTGRYFLLPPFFHGNYSGLYDAGDPSDHGTGTQKAACTALCCLPSLLLGLVYIMIR